MGFLGTTEMLIIAGVIVLLFGASKLPKLGGAIGESIKNFKKGIKDENPRIEEQKKDSEGRDV
jgi:sec-independent protein translocase protein TatA